MDVTYCKDCAHFIQHYGLNSGKFTRLYCGHCVLSRPKKKSPDSRSCDHFQPGENPEDALVDKEYLYKELLHRVLSLELAPEIEHDTGSRG